MRVQDIKVGEDYGYATYEHGERSKVTVLEVGLPMRVGSFYRNKTQKIGVRVRFTTGEERTILARNIRDPWAKCLEALERHQAQQRRLKEEADRVDRLVVLLQKHGIHAARTNYAGDAALIVRWNEADKLFNMLKED